MRVTIVSCVFPPEPVTSAVTSKDIAEALATRGHAVTVIAPYPARPRRLPFSQVPSARQLFAHTSIRVIRIKPICGGSRTAVGRLIENFSFGLLSTLAVLRSRPQAVYVNTWPIFAAFLTVTVSRFLARARVMLSMQDVYPEAAISIGLISEAGFASGLMRCIDHWTGRATHILVAISQRMASSYTKTRPWTAARVVTISNWIDGSRFNYPQRRDALLTRFNISSTATVLVYAGNVGSLAAVETVVEAARLSDRGRNKLFFIIAGDGSRQKDCARRAQGLKNICFICPCSEQDLLRCLSVADIAILPTKRGAALSSVPSKLLSYMFSATPTIAAVDAMSDTAQVLTESRAGIVVPPEDADALICAALMLRDNKLQRMQLGKNAACYAAKHFSQSQNVQKVVSLIEAGLVLG